MVSADVHTLVKMLGYEHSFRRRHTEFIRRVLLKRRRRKRRRSVLFGNSLFYFRNRKRTVPDLLFNLIRKFFPDAFAVLLALISSFERRIFSLFVLQYRVEIPILVGNERLNFAFPVHNQPQRNRLNPARRKPVLDTVIEKRGKFVTDESVQNSARLLCVYEIIIYFSGFFQSVFNGGRRNFVKFDTVLAVLVKT